MEFSRQESWSGLPFPSPIKSGDSEKWIDSGCVLKVVNRIGCVLYVESKMIPTEEVL